MLHFFPKNIQLRVYPVPDGLDDIAWVFNRTTISCRLLEYISASKNKLPTNITFFYQNDICIYFWND